MQVIGVGLRCHISSTITFTDKVIINLGEEILALGIVLAKRDADLLNGCKNDNLFNEYHNLLYLFIIIKIVITSI